MLKPIRLACATVLPLLICGCQSFSTPRMQPVAVQRQQRGLTQRMLNELSGLPMPETKD